MSFKFRLQLLFWLVSNLKKFQQFFLDREKMIEDDYRRKIRILHYKEMEKGITHTDRTSFNIMEMP